MKLLKIKVTGLPLLNGVFEIDFMALNRVNADNAEKLNLLFKNSAQEFYQNNVISFVGINASGKTTALKLITFVLRLLNNEPVNSIPHLEIFDGAGSDDEIYFDTVFLEEKNTVYNLKTIICRKNEHFYIKDETLISKPLSKVKNKTDLFRFEKESCKMARNNDELFLLDDVSIAIAFNKKSNSKVILSDLLEQTNINQLSISENCPAELISFFDPSIEYLQINKNGKETDIRLCFKGKSEIILTKISDLNRYLSSGTIKGINVFMSAVNLFKTGGFLIVDELENHFNYEIVAELIRFFMDSRINPGGAMLVFSTHYSELLDEFDRNDNIYIVRNNNGISAEKLSNKLKRTDVKKSDAFQSDMLVGTAPSYDSYIRLKKSLINAQKEA